MYLFSQINQRIQDVVQGSPVQIVDGSCPDSCRCSPNSDFDLVIQNNNSWKTSFLAYYF